MKTIACIIVWAVVTLAAIAPARPCSIFTAHDATTVLVGNNEDYKVAYVDATIIWFVPASAGKHGYVAWGYKFNHSAQGGMNDQGLFFDGLATPTHEVTASGTTPFTATTLEEVMQTSATVDQAIASLKEHDLTSVFAEAQVMFVDKSGGSAIFDGSVVTKPTGTYQIGTNFLPADPTLGNYPCWRYTKLEQMTKTGLQLTPAYFVSMAKAVKQGASTLYTIIADLKAGTFHVYYWGDFDKHVFFDLQAEMKKGKHEVTIADLFKTVQDAGVDGGADAGVDGSGSEAGADTSIGGDAPLGGDADVDGGGCSCSVPGRGGSDRHSTVLLALLLMVALPGCSVRPIHRLSGALSANVDVDADQQAASDTRPAAGRC